MIRRIVCKIVCVLCSFLISDFTAVKNLEMLNTNPAVEQILFCILLETGLPIIRFEKQQLVSFGQNSGFYVK